MSSSPHSEYNLKVLTDYLNLANQMNGKIIFTTAINPETGEVKFMMPPDIDKEVLVKILETFINHLKPVHEGKPTTYTYSIPRPL